MNRVMYMHGAKFGLIYDILQSCCIGKASEAIKFCNSVKDPQKAVEAALDRLKSVLVMKQLLLKLVLLA